MTFDWGYDPKVDFSAPKTFAWMPGPRLSVDDPRIDAPLLEKRIREAVASQLETRGYTRKLAGTPDFYVAYQVALKGKLSVKPVPSVYGFDPGWGWHHRGQFGSGPTGTGPYVKDAEAGSLILDIIEPEGSKLVWRGYIEAHIDPDRDSERKKIERINEAFRLLFEPFPPRRRAIPSERREQGD
jgi:hypothetical protein